MPAPPIKLLADKTALTVVASVCGLSYVPDVCVTVKLSAPIRPFNWKLAGVSVAAVVPSRVLGRIAGDRRGQHHGENRAEGRSQLWACV